MLKLAEHLVPYPYRYWYLARQMGVRYAVASLPRDEQGEKLWSYMDLLHMKKRYEDFGFEVSVIEDAPPMDKIRLGVAGRDEEIEYMKQFITDMGALGIPVLCYNFMAQFNWVRSSTTTLSRGGALVTSFDNAMLKNAPLTEAGIVSEAQLWDNLQYFLERIVPVAEKAKVKLAMHPDDPPISPIRGVSRILCSANDLQRVIDMVPSEYSGITFCQGTLATAGEDIPTTIRHFAKQNKIFFVHFRDVRGNAEKFEETFHDDGQNDMFEAMKTYYEVGYDGPVRPDHVPTMEGEDNSNPGYETLGRLFSVGYMKGLMEGASK